MNPKKKARMQRALLRRQIDLEKWTDGTMVDIFLPGAVPPSPAQIEKKKLTAKTEIAILSAKLGYNQS